MGVPAWRRRRDFAVCSPGSSRLHPGSGSSERVALGPGESHAGLLSSEWGPIHPFTEMRREAGKIVLSGRLLLPSDQPDVLHVLKGR
jgi:hypothetical protein